MSLTNVMSLIEQLDDEVDDLENAIAPLTDKTLAETAPKLPLLDKAKLYVLVAYAIESMLFSFLRLHGINAREHPVFQELTRVKQYFAKIKKAETPVEQNHRQVLDKNAAARFIKAGLSGNDKYDLARAEQQAKERARSQMLSRMQGPSKKTSIDQVEETRSMDDKKPLTTDPESEASKLETRESHQNTKKRKSSRTNPELEAPKVENKESYQNTKKRKVDTSLQQNDNIGKDQFPAEKEPEKKKKKKKKRKMKKLEQIKQENTVKKEEV